MTILDRFRLDGKREDHQHRVDLRPHRLARAPGRMVLDGGYTVM